MNPISDNQHLYDIQRFYEILNMCEAKVGSKRTLAISHGRMKWPKRGVYFFFESGEIRTTSGLGLRVVRIGSHCLKRGNKSTLWNRLSKHQGTSTGMWPGGGNHRGSVFRLHIGKALINRDSWTEETRKTWGAGSSAKREIRDQEYPLEKTVSNHIRNMPFLWLEIDDEPGPESKRAFIERNAIALLSNYLNDSNKIDPSSIGWLGNQSPNESIRRSGLWNVDFVGESYNPDFLNELQRMV